MVKAKKKRFSLTNVLMNIDCDTAAVVLLIAIAIQPLYGLFTVVSSQEDLVALFYGKATAIRLIGMLGLVLGFVNWFQNKKIYGSEYLRRKMFGNPWNFCFALIFIWSVLTSLTACYPYYSFFSYAYRYEGLLSYFAYAGVYICGSLVRDDDRRRRIIDVALVTAAILAVFTLLSQLGKDDGSFINKLINADLTDSESALTKVLEKFHSNILSRGGWVGAYSGTFINTNHYGYYLCVILMLSYGRTAYSEHLWSKLLFIGSFILNEYVLLQNNSFGPFLAVSIGMVGLFVFATVRDGIKKSWWLLIPFVTFFGLDYLVNSGKMLQAYSTTFNEILAVFGAAGNAVASGTSVSEALGAEGSAGSGRMEFWLAALDVWKKYPISGCGPENIPIMMYDALGSNEAVHNEYIQVLAEMGIVGFLLYFGGHVWFFVRNAKTFRHTKPASLIAYAAVAAYLVSAAFGITITVSEVFFFFVLGLANGSHTTDVMCELEDTVAAKLGKKVVPEIKK